MHRILLLLMTLLSLSCTDHSDTTVAARPEILRDIEGYAIAVCLMQQSEPYLKDQGEAWASVIIQRMKGNPEALVDLAEQVKRENSKGGMAIVRNEIGPGPDKKLPLLYCYEIVDQPTVRSSIQKAVDSLKKSYN